jgi:hypothetical protein
MDIATLATAMIAAKAAQAQLAVAAKMMRMNAQMEASVVQLVDAGQQNAAKLTAAMSQSGVDKYA